MASQIHRQQSDQSADPWTLDRRNHERAPLSPCPLCAGSDNRVVTRTDYVLYVRCHRCPHVWSIPKPGVPPLGYW